MQKPLTKAFCRVDLLVLVGTAVFLTVWALPALSRSGTRSERAICVNNLRLIGGGFTRWASDNNERYPWQLYRPLDGGTAPRAYSPANLWLNYFWISNYLRSPKFLADPADYRRPGQPALLTAGSWHNIPGGFIHAAYRNNALSYSVGIYSAPVEPNSILSSDRNIHAPTTFDTPVFDDVRSVNASTATWKTSVHVDAGNLLFSDGRVEETDTPRLKEAVGWNNNWNRGFLFPFVE